MEATHVGDVNIKSSSYSSDSAFAVLPNNRMIIAGSRKVELIDCHTGTILSVLELPGLEMISDVALINAHEAVITLGRSKKIIVLRVSDTLTVEREIPVSGECHGVTYYHGNLWVTFICHPRLEKIDLHGNVIRRLEYDSDGDKPFTRPLHLCVLNVHGQDVAFVTDVTNDDGNVVISIGIDTLNTRVYYSGDDGFSFNPRSICADALGNVYICYYLNDEINVIDPKSGLIWIVSEASRDVERRINYIDYCNDTSRLFVCYFGSDVCRMFQFE